MQRLEPFASISDPELQMWLNEKTRETRFQITRDIASSMTLQNTISWTGKGYNP